MLVKTLEFVLGAACQVTGEFSVGRMPLRLDIVVVRRTGRARIQMVSGELSPIIEHLNRNTLIEFKSPSDTLRAGDLSHFLGASLLWFAQQESRTVAADVTALVIAPWLTIAGRSELKRLGFPVTESSPGTHRVDGCRFSTWILESDTLGKEDPVLAFFSREAFRRRLIGQTPVLGFRGLSRGGQNPCFFSFLTGS